MRAQATAGPPSGLGERATPLSLMDRALSLLRRTSAAQWLASMLAALPLAAASLLVYDLERVEGVRAPLWLFGLLFAAAFWARFVLLSRIARQYVQALSPGLPVSASAPDAIAGASTAAIAGVGLCCWAAPLLALGRVSAFALIAALPLLCVRGAVAPSLLARSACSTEQGWAAWSRAREDTRGARGLMLGLAFLGTQCLLLLFGNLYAFAATALVLANSVLGLDVGVLGAFLSPDNDFALLLLLGGSALLLEPLQAALSAVAYCEARGRNEGADLHVAIDALGGLPSALGAGPRVSSALPALLLACALSLLAPGVHAEPAPDDDAVRAHVQEILRRHEFHEFDASGPKLGQFSDWLERALRRHEEPDRPEIAAPQFQLRLPATFVVLVSLGLLIAVLVYVSREARRSAEVPSTERAAATSSSLHPPAAARSIDEQLATASQAAQAGDYSAALCALYGVCLVLLARAHAVSLDAARTNGQYLRLVAPGPVREGFARVTLSFERTRYGHRPASALEYEQARRFAETLRPPAAGRGT